MPNRLSPGCCCGCDIFQADFDLRYVLPTIPATTTDWTSAQVRPFPGARRMTIPKDSIGEGLVFTQTVGGSVTQANPRRQTFVPEFTEHPDPAPIRALPGFALYVYRILPNEGGTAAGFYSLTPTTRTGPTATMPVSMGIELDWTTYWRRHFRLLDEDGEEVPGPDRFPFTLNAGERLESLQSFPVKWFSLVFTNLIYPNWRTDPESIARFSLIDDDGDELASILADYTTVGTTRHPRYRLSKAGEVLHDLVHAVGTGFGDPLPNLQWLIRNDHFEAWISNETGFEYAQPAEPTYTTIAPNPWLLDPVSVFKKTGFPYVFLGDFPATRLRIQVEGNERRLGIAAAERAKGDRPTKQIIEDVETTTVEAINPTCPAKHTNAAIWPHHKTRWELRGFDFPGLTAPTLEQYAHKRQSGLFLLKDYPAIAKTAPVALATVPAGRFGGSSIWLRSGAWQSSTPQTKSFALSLSPCQITMQVQPTSDLAKVRLIAQIQAEYYRSSTNTSAGAVTNTQTLTLSSPLSGVISYTVDPAEPLTGGYSDAGWAVIPLSAEITGATPVGIAWDQLVDRWEGDDFEIELHGADATITNITAAELMMIESRTVSATQIGTTNEAEILTTGVNAAFNIADLTLIIGGPDELP
jgi:hypothetical protein